MRRNYSYNIQRVENDKIFISDDDLPNTRSVTNSAEEVVTEIYRIYGDLRIIYRDSEGDIAELEHHEGIFLGFLDYVE